MHIAMSPLLPTKTLRNMLLRLIGVCVPSSSYLAAGTIVGSDKVRIGEQVGINVCCHLDGAAEVFIEDFVRIGANTVILTGTHDIEPDIIRRDTKKATIALPVRIGRGSWICANVTVLPGVEIGEGCVVAAGSVVTKSLAPNGLYAGIPAVLIRNLPISEKR